MGTGSLPEVNLPERDGDHTLHSSAGLRMGWTYIPASHLSLRRHVMGSSLPLQDEFTNTIIEDTNY